MVVDFGLNVVNFNGGCSSSQGTLDIFDENGKIKIEYLPEGAIGTSTFELYMCTNASDTPVNVTWFDGTDYITGTLLPSEQTMSKIYFVLQNIEANAYNQYATFKKEGSYEWKCIGSGIYDKSELEDIEERLSKLEDTSEWKDVK
jgi:hypothetical protein